MIQDILLIVVTIAGGLVLIAGALVLVAFARRLWSRHC
jgi:hypothetical protein